MSHFVTFVLVKNLEQLEKEIEILLSPYDENVKVSEYERGCYCINEEARKESTDLADIKFGSVNELGNTFWKQYTHEQLENQEDELNKKWISFIKPRNDFIDSEIKKHNLYNKANVNCITCSGTGKEKTTYNPFSKWDLYSLGGRFNDYICYDETLKNEIMQKYPKSFLPNIIPTEYVTEAPFAIVSEKIGWIEKGKMGWFGISTDNLDQLNWEEYVKKILKEHQNYYAVLVDCHI